MSAQRSLADQPATAAIITSLIPMVDGSYHCPECGSKFGKLKTLARHRHRDHGLVGRPGRRPAAPDPFPYKNGKYICPECGYAHAKKMSLASHRSIVHGIKSMSPGAIYQRAQKARRKAAMAGVHANGTATASPPEPASDAPPPEATIHFCPQCGFNIAQFATLSAMVSRMETRRRARAPL